MDFINNFINAVSGILYQPWCVPLILLAGGIILTVRSKFIQVRLIKESFKVILEKPSTENGISSFGALMVSTASRVGTGNIIGVATAICAGGAGAVFWMWVTAIIGGASAYGGTGTVPGVIIGATLMGVINLGMNIMGVDANYQKVVKGAVLLVAVIFDVVSKRKSFIAK